MNLIFYTHKVYSSRVSVQTMGALGDSERRQDTPGSWRRRDKIVLASSRPTLACWLGMQLFQRCMLLGTRVLSCLLFFCSSGFVQLWPP